MKRIVVSVLALCFLVLLVGCNVTVNNTTPSTTEKSPLPDDDTTKTYTVTFKSEGAEDITERVAYGDKIPFPDFSRGDEYSLVGWKDLSTGERVTGDTYQYNENKVFVALWEANWSQGF